jgi:hypothetical protein
MKISAAQMVRFMKPSCADCAYFQREEADWGLCKANAPQVQMLTDENFEPYCMTFWPQVDQEERICGQFKAGN